MPQRKKKVTFDAMVKFFMQHYDIPTKKDMEKLNARLERVEQLLMNATKSGGLSGRAAKTGSKSRISRKNTVMTASDMVLDVIRKSEEGIGFAEIQKKTGFEEKKLRNIIFRLNDTGRIRRKRRGIYIIS